MLTAHRSDNALGNNPHESQQAYSDPFPDAISEDRLKEIRAYLQQQRVLVTPRFQAHIEAMHGRRATILPRGRPKRRDQREI